jgi:hypothetical protein
MMTTLPVGSISTAATWRPAAIAAFNARVRSFWRNLITAGPRPSHLGACARSDTPESRKTPGGDPVRSASAERLSASGIKSPAWLSNYEKIATQSGLRMIAGGGSFVKPSHLLSRSPIFAIFANKLKFIFPEAVRAPFCNPRTRDHKIISLRNLFLVPLFQVGLELAHA